MTDRIAEAGAVEFAVNNLDSSLTIARLGGAGQIQSAYAEYSAWRAANPTATINTLSARGRLYYAFDNNIVGAAMTILRAYGGTLFAPSTTTCFSDSAGTTPAVKDGVVGCLVDSVTPMGPERISNGAFDTDLTGWVLGSDPAQVIATWSAGAVSLTRGAGGTAGFYWPNAFAVGKRYLITFDVISGVAAIGNGVPTTGGLTAGSKRLIQQATGTALQVWVNANNSTCVIDNISVREVGLIATQDTTGYKPILRRGAKNLLTYSEDFSNAEWHKGTTVQTAMASEVNPLGVTGGVTKLEPAAADTNALVYRDYTTSSVGLYLTYSIWVKSVSGASFAIVFRLTDQGAIAFPGGGAQTVSVTEVWQKVTITAAIPAGCTSARTYIGGSSSWAYGENILVWGAQLEVGSTPSAYVATTTAPASNGIGPWWLDFDGVDDRLELSAVPFQMADDHFVIVGTKNLSSAATSKPAFSAYGTTTRRCGQLSFETTTLTATWTDDAGTAGTSPTGSAVTVGTSVVGTARKAGNAKSLRKDGALVNTSNTAAGTTTLTTSGVGADGAVFSNGPIYAIALGKGAITDSELKIVERYIGQLSGVTIT